jgi:HEAT repeat protein
MAVGLSLGEAFSCERQVPTWRPWVNCTEFRKDCAVASGKELRALDLKSIIAQFEQDSEVGEGWFDYSIDQAACALAEQGEEGIQYLLDAYPTAAASQAQAALIALSLVEPPLDGLAELYLRALDDPRPQVLDSAFHGLGALGIREPVDRIAAYRTHDEEILRSSSFAYLVRVFPQRAIEQLDSAVDDPSWRVRARAFFAVNFSEDEHLIAAGISHAWRYIDDPQSFVRSEANWLLWAHYWDYETPHVDILKERTSTNPRIRASAIRSGLEFHPQYAPDVLPAAHADPERVVRLNALDVIEEIYRLV